MLTKHTHQFEQWAQDNDRMMAIKAKKAAEHHIKAQKRSNRITFAASIAVMVYGLTFMSIMPGLNGLILGVIISLFGVLLFGFSIASRPNHGPNLK